MSTQSDRVLAYIEDHPLCTVLDMTRHLDPFVGNIRARISDARAALREAGGDIVCERRSDGRAGFRVVRAARPVLRGEPVELGL